MSDSRKPKQPVWPLPSTPPKPDGAPQGDGGRPGRVVHDARGNAVWDWTRAPTDSTTHLLRKLDSPELSLIDDAAGKTAPAEPGAGLDPYNKRNDRPAGNAEAKPAEPKAKAPKDGVLKQLLGKR